MIPDGCSVILNVGTTTEEVARALVQRRDLVVITNNLNVVGILSGTPAKEIIITGGVVRQSDGAIVGDEAVEFIRRFKADFAVIGASALDADGAVMDYDLREVAVARAIVANARRTILVCDRLKFERIGAGADLRHRRICTPSSPTRRRRRRSRRPAPGRASRSRSRDPWPQPSRTRPTPRPLDRARRAAPRSAPKLDRGGGAWDTIEHGAAGRAARLAAWHGRLRHGGRVAAGPTSFRW